MQLYNGLTFEQVIERQAELFQRIPVQIDPLSRENDCYPNCLRKVERDGGSVVVGWRRTLATTDAKVIGSLDHHAVWLNPEGILIDISRRIHIFNGQAAILTDEYTDFMPDPTTAFGEDMLALPSRYMPLVADSRGLLKQACERMDRRALLLLVGDEERAAYEHTKIVGLLRKHLGRK